MAVSSSSDYAEIETSGPLFDEVSAALDEVRPTLQDVGGDVRLIEIEDSSIAIVELFGKCVGCPMSELTVRHGIEAHLRVAVPRIMAVDVVSDRSVPVRNFTDVLARATFKPL
jgi:Fe-S cluster biogenesis protein NfuA